MEGKKPQRSSIRSHRAITEQLWAAPAPRHDHHGDCLETSRVCGEEHSVKADSAEESPSSSGASSQRDTQNPSELTAGSREGAGAGHLQASLSVSGVSDDKRIHIV